MLMLCRGPTRTELVSTSSFVVASLTFRERTGEPAWVIVPGRDLLGGDAFDALEYAGAVAGSMRATP